jgi:hypothetical protein
MATLSASPLGGGHVTITSSGSVTNATQCNIWNLTQSNRLIYSGAYNNSSLNVTDFGPTIHTSNSYGITYYSSTGTNLGSLTTSATPEVTNAGSISVTDAGGGNVNVSWTYPTELNTTLSANSANLWVNSSATNFPAGTTSTTVSRGYSDTSSYMMTFLYDNTMGSQYIAQSTPTQNFTTPPAPPNPATGGVLVSDDLVNNISISWTASVGGADGYLVERSINGGAWTTRTTTASTSYTDNATGATRPIQYRIRAYNSNSGGTSYASSYAFVDALLTIFKNSQTLWTVNSIISKVVQKLWTVFNARLIPDTIASVSGLTGTVSNVQENPDSVDANWNLGAASWNIRFTFQNPNQAGSFGDPQNRQRFRIIVRT